MTARQSVGVHRALAYLKRSGCSIAAAAGMYGVNVSSVRRALAKLGVPANPVGRPKRR